MKIIAITGTKGKTTVTRMIDWMLGGVGHEVLRVDNDGHFINGEQKSSEYDSLNLSGKTPSVCPGKYLITMKDCYPDFTAVLEASIGCRGAGLGYGKHDVGIFLNVFEDHLNAKKHLCTQADLAEAKSFIFSKIKKGGCAIFNAEDELVCGQLSKISGNNDIKMIAIQTNTGRIDSEKFLNSGGEVFMLDGENIVLKTSKKSQHIMSVDELPAGLGKAYMPIAINAMFALAGIYAYREGNTGDADVERLKSFTFSPEGGRMVRLKSVDGIEIIIDFAHEKYSLIEIAKLARKISCNRVIGVLRIAPGKKESTIHEIAVSISPFFEDVIVYDKIDGIRRGPYRRGTADAREVGETADLFSKALITDGHVSVWKCLAEEDAIRQAAVNARPGDCVVIIHNDHPLETYQLAKKYFNMSTDLSW